MRFWIINAQENPAEPRHIAGRREWRSNTLSETLADRGHDVIRWRSAFSHQAKQYLSQGSQKISHDNYHHQFIDGPAYQRHVGLRRIRHHRALGQNFRKLAVSYTEQPDLIHVGNVPIALASAAVSYGKQNDIPVIVDIRDLWPDIYVDLIPSRLAGLRTPALRVLHMTAFQLKQMLKDATGISALTQSYLRWALDLADRPQHENDHIFEMCYPKQIATPSQADISTLRKRLDLKPNHIIASYAGNIGRQSDFVTLIRAARKLKETTPNVRLVLAGSGPATGHLQSLSGDLDNVIMPGWLTGSELSSLMALSSIGLIAYRPVPNFLRNIPNKFSEYLASGLAIACGLGGEMGRLVDEYECGFTYRPGDADMLATEIDALIKDPARLSAMGERAQNLHHNRFDGAQIYPRFADYLENIAAGRKSPC